MYIDEEKILRSNKIYFESRIRIAEKLFEEELYEDCINFIEKTASFGWFNFSGYYKSELLEILLSKIQKKILSQSDHQKKKGISGNILHICSEVYATGGHSKLLYNWIKNDTLKKHSILSTRLSFEELKSVSDFYLEESTHIQQISIKSSSKIASINLLNQQRLNAYDLIILHIHPDEVITNIVLSQNIITTPVYFVNHADHVFWLGTSISDLILQIREANIPLDVIRRGIPAERQFFLPIPVENIFHIKEDQENDVKFIQLLSTGTGYKYKPNGKYNFLREAYKIVEENPNVIFNIVGLYPDSPYAKEYLHDRIILHGILSSVQLAEMEKRADIYVESFPMASFTALLQAALCKTAFILHYHPLPLFKLFSDHRNYHIFYPADISEWHTEIKKLIHDRMYRIAVADQQYHYISTNFSIKIWKSLIRELYYIADKLVHVFWQPTSDEYYDGDNEKLLINIDQRNIFHYSFTERMSLSGKYFVYKMSKPKNKNIHYLSGKKQLLKYFLYK